MVTLLEPRYSGANETEYAGINGHERHEIAVADIPRDVYLGRVTEAFPHMPEEGTIEYTLGHDVF